ncbi:MAG TPA: FliH/SctL family protein [Bryobacteraceae bacterium]|nr:FliH/SctL family protein [Bryobacteraceae bacterium]
MWSRVLKGSAAQTAPTVWRALGASAPEVRAASAGDSDVGRLRARIAEMESSLEACARRAYAEGVEAGEQSVRQKLENGVRETLEQLSSVIGGLAESRAEALRRAEADAVRLSIEIARRVLHRELAADPSALEALVKAALAKLEGQEVYRVRAHPGMESLVRSCLEQNARVASVEVVADPAQQPGGIVFEISRGALDASVGTQLAEIERGLVDRLEARP